MSNCVYSQVEHSNYNGVVPEIASRTHLKKITSICDYSLKESKVKRKNLTGIAYSQGPGLLGSLIVGSCFAKGLSLALNIPLYSINHLEAHVFSLLIEKENNFKFPYLALLVSGGHTQIVLVKSFNDVKIVGTTRDDAAGEAFDKIAITLGLDYPGGHKIDSLSKGGINSFVFPKSNMPNLDFSFSGLKTAVLNFVKNNQKNNQNFVENNLKNICYSVQNIIVEMLIEKLLLACNKYNIKTIGICGGVSANSYLRKKILDLKTKGFIVNIPKFEYCTDNGAMIAFNGFLKAKYNIKSSHFDIPFSKQFINR